MDESEPRVIGAVSHKLSESGVQILRGQKQKSSRNELHHWILPTDILSHIRRGFCVYVVPLDSVPGMESLWREKVLG